MGKVLRLFWPRSVGGYVTGVLAGLLLLFCLATAAVGQFDLQELQRNGSYETFPVSEILARDGNGAPTAVVVDLSSLNGQHPRVENVQGSMVGDDKIELRLTRGADLLMAAQDYRNHHVWLEVLKVCLIPVGLGLAALAAINFRDTFLYRVVPAQWSVDADPDAGHSRPTRSVS